MGPGTVQAIERLLGRDGASRTPCSPARPTPTRAGERYAARHAELAAAAGVRFERLAPTAGTDWNDVLRQRRRP